MILKDATKIVHFLASLFLLNMEEKEKKKTLEPNAKMNIERKS